MRGSDGFDRTTPQLGRSVSMPEGSFQMDWQVPRAPVRFPLRDALLSFQESTHSPSVQEAEASSSNAEAKGPLVVHMTEKAKLRKYLSHRKRYDLDPPALGELHASAHPRPPAEQTQRRPAKKALNTYGTESRVQARRSAEDAGWSTWLPKTVVQPQGEPAPDSHTSTQAAIRGTLTSSARAVLSHSRRFAAESLVEQSNHSSTHGGGSTAHGSSAGGGKASGAAKKSAPDPLAAWSPQRQTRGLPRPVKEWVCRGLEFTDAGLGIGDRFDTDIANRARRAPGHIYEQDFGNIGRWKSDASMPTKQPDGKHTSAETHKMGARRDVSAKRDRQRPGPGTYEFMGFAQELAYNISKRPKGEAPGRLSPPSSPKGSQMLQSSGNISQS